MSLEPYLSIHAYLFIYLVFFLRDFNLLLRRYIDSIVLFFVPLGWLHFGMVFCCFILLFPKVAVHISKFSSF